MYGQLGAVSNIGRASEPARSRFQIVEVNTHPSIDPEFETLIRATKLKYPTLLGVGSESGARANRFSTERADISIAVIQQMSEAPLPAGAAATGMPVAKSEVAA